MNSNGVALHTDPEEAAIRSTAELIERDTVLAHYYTSLPGLKKYDLKRLASARGAKEITDALAALSAKFESCWVFQLCSPVPAIQVYWLVLERDGIAASGWATGRPDDHTVIPKAFSEALSGYRFARHPANRKVIEHVSNADSGSITHKTFLTVARQLGVTNTDLQCAVLLSSDPTGKRLKFLANCGEASSLASFVAAQETRLWYPQPSISFQQIQQREPSPYTVLRAISADVFQVDWPSVHVEEINLVAEHKGIAGQLGSNIYAPCIIY